MLKINFDGALSADSFCGGVDVVVCDWMDTLVQARSDRCIGSLSLMA